MFKTALRVLAATGFGIFIGLRLSAGLEYAFPGYGLAVIGGLIGCLVGWVGLAPRQFLANAKRAWNETMTPYKLSNFGRTTILALRAAFWLLVAVFSGFTSFWLAVSALILAANGGARGVLGFGGLCIFFGVLGFLAIICVLPTAILFDKRIGRATRWNELRTLASNAREIAWNIGPAMSAYWIVRGLYLLVASTPTWGPVFKDVCVELGDLLWRFVKLVIVYTHDNLRTIVFVDTAIGWGIGWTLSTTYGMGFAGDLAGIVLGAGWAVFNYIVVARGWLKLEPRLSAARQ